MITSHEKPRIITKKFACMESVKMFFEAIFPSSGTFFSKYFAIILCDISGLENVLLSFSENNIIVLRAYMCSNRFRRSFFYANSIQKITRVWISFLTKEEHVCLLEVVLSISERKGVSFPL